MYYAVWISYCALVCEKYVVFLTTIEQTPGVRKRLSPVQKPLVGYEAQPDLYHSSPFLFQLLPYNPIPLQNAPFWKARKKKKVLNLPSPTIIWELLKDFWDQIETLRTERTLKLVLKKKTETESHYELKIWTSPNAYLVIASWSRDLKQNPTTN